MPDTDDGRDPAGRFFRFSARHFPEKRRVEAIRDGYASVAQIDITPLDRAERFDCAGSTVVLPSLVISEMSISPCEITRRGNQLSHNSDLIVLGVATRYGLVARQNEREPIECATGEAYLRGNDEPGGLVLPSGMSGVVNIAIPFRELNSAVRDLDGRLRKIAPSPELKLLIGYTRELLRAGGDLPGPAAALASAHVRDLVALALGAEPDAREVARARGLRVARLAAIKADISEQTGNPNLSLAWLAKRHGVAPRYIQNLFYAENTNFSEHVMHARLDHARAQLCDPRHAAQTITAIALASGFGDLSWFNRTFRRRFGMSPSDMRALAAKQSV